jgi:hypothetical protein
MPVPCVDLRQCHCASDEHAKGLAAFSGEDTNGLEPASFVIVSFSAPPVNSSGDPKQQPATSESSFQSSREPRQGKGRANDRQAPQVASVWYWDDRAGESCS